MSREREYTPRAKLEMRDRLDAMVGHMMAGLWSTTADTVEPETTKEFMVVQASEMLDAIDAHLEADSDG